MKYSYILWDWNGTLLDDVDISVDCVNILLDKLGLEKTNREEYYQMMDMPIKRYYENLFSSRKSELDYETCTENFHKNYPDLIEGASLHKGVIDILEYFKSKGVRQSIVSAFEKTSLINHTNKFGVAKYFEAISGNDDVYVGSKSQRAIDLVKDIDRSKVLYIGDTKADVETALDVGCDCILFAKGHQSKEYLKQFNLPIIEDLSELKKL